MKIFQEIICYQIKKNMNSSKNPPKADLNLGDVPENIMSEFKTTVESIFSNKINIKIEIGDVINSPIQLNESKIEQEENLAKDQINKDKEIKDFVEKFNGKIKPESIKPS